MVEQPLIFLTHASSYPLSLALSLLEGEDAQSIYAASVVFAFPSIILWRVFSDEVIRSIEHVKPSASGQDDVDDS